MKHAPGTDIAMRNIVDSKVWFAWPMRVVEDGERGLLAAQVAGSVGKAPAATPHSYTALVDVYASGRADLVDAAWSKTLTLSVLVPEQWWSTRLMWAASTGEFLGWYVDLRLPIRRTGRCVDTCDLQLDLVVRPDGHWWWKDEDDYALARTTGLVDDTAHAAVEAAKPDLVATVESRRFPFDDSLTESRPARDPLPALPPDWDRSPVQTPPPVG